MTRGNLRGVPLQWELKPNEGEPEPGFNDPKPDPPVSTEAPQPRQPTADEVWDDGHVPTEPRTSPYGSSPTPSE